MTNLDRVSVGKESESAWVEGGATLGQTYYAIAEASSVHGFSAGSCPTVGVGGDISGGGFGLLSRKYGLAADNVLDALLVNADGVLLDREAMGEDVFWAIRGGGGGYFQSLRIVEAECEEMSWIESNLYFAGLGSKTTVLDLKNRYLQDKLYYKAKSDYVRTPISRSGINTALDILEKEPKGYVILDPYGGVMQNISSESIAFPHREGNIFTIQYRVEWKQADNAKSSDYVRGFYSSMTPYVSSGPRAAYVNYMDLDLGVMELIRTSVLSSSDAVKTARTWGGKYFLKNYDTLVRAKTAIDPNNVFRHQQGIPPMSTAAEKYI